MYVQYLSINCIILFVNTIIQNKIFSPNWALHWVCLENTRNIWLLTNFHELNYLFPASRLTFESWYEFELMQDKWWHGGRIIKISSRDHATSPLRNEPGITSVITLICSIQHIYTKHLLNNWRISSLIISTVNHNDCRERTAHLG